MPNAAKPSNAQYFAVRVAEVTRVENPGDIRRDGLRSGKVLYVDRDARLNTSPEGTRLDTEALAHTFLQHALPLVRSRHGTAVELEVIRLRATGEMEAGWIYRHSWQIRAILGIAEPPPPHQRRAPATDGK